MPSATTIARQTEAKIDDLREEVTEAMAEMAEAQMGLIKRVANLQAALTGIWEEVLTEEQRQTLMAKAGKEASNIIEPVLFFNQ